MYALVQQNPLYNEDIMSHFDKIKKIDIISNFNKIKNSNIYNYFSIVFNISNTALGAGILTLPYTVHKCGLILAPLLLIFMFLFTCVSVHMLIYSAEKTKKDSYKEIGSEIFKETLGKKFSVLYEIPMLILALSVCVIYTSIISGTMGPQFAYFFKIEDSLWLRAVCTVPIMIVVGIICLKKEIGFIGWGSFASFIVMLYICVIVIVNFVNRIPKGLPTKYKIWDFDGINIALSAYIFSCSIHPTVLPSYKELNNKSAFKMLSLSYVGLFIIIFLYLIVSIVGYISLADSKGFLDGIDNILSIYNQNDVSVIIARFSIVIVMMFSYALLFFVARDSFFNIIEVFKKEDDKIEINEELRINEKENDKIEINEEENEKEFKLSDMIPERKTIKEWIFWIIISFMIWIVTTTFGIFVPRITVVFGLVISSTGTIVFFIMPGIFYIHLVEENWKKISAAFLTFLIGMLGFYCFFVSLFQQIQNIKG